MPSACSATARSASIVGRPPVCLYSTRPSTYATPTRPIGRWRSSLPSSTSFDAASRDVGPRRSCRRGHAGTDVRWQSRTCRGRRRVRDSWRIRRPQRLRLIRHGRCCSSSRISSALTCGDPQPVRSYSPLDRSDDTGLALAGQTCPAIPTRSNEAGRPTTSAGRPPHGGELLRIAADADAFLLSLVDREAVGEGIVLADGTCVPRLPGYRKWMWDGEFCGSIGFRWRPGTEALPPTCLGHIGYTVVPWKRGRGVRHERAPTVAA